MHSNIGKYMKFLSFIKYWSEENMATDNSIMEIRNNNAAKNCLLRLSCLTLKYFL